MAINRESCICFDPVLFCYREDYYQEGNVVHSRLKVLEAFKRALVTWARWVDKNIDNTKTEVIFRGYSETHFRYVSNFIFKFHAE